MPVSLRVPASASIVERMTMIAMGERLVWIGRRGEEFDHRQTGTAFYHPTRPAAWQGEDAGSNVETTCNAFTKAADGCKRDSLRPRFFPRRGHPNYYVFNYKARRLRHGHGHGHGSTFTTARKTVLLSESLVQRPSGCSIETAPNIRSMAPLWKSRGNCGSNGCRVLHKITQWPQPQNSLLEPLRPA